MESDGSCGLVSHKLEFSQVDLGNLPRFQATQTWIFKPPGHIPKPPWHCAKRDLGMCPDWLEIPYFSACWFNASSSIFRK
ncbi:hypothetical protein VP01_2650g1 [Puccinia sorghi]|uniref:Uncharacterized protein n=1 Tax=Puccinia sorghi TaxID=27349 RepID=A0A0L6V603_9BASI|nr:hypothetical protein VP01_2650g1 [Puccinia sorghi]